MSDIVQGSLDGQIKRWMVCLVSLWGLNIPRYLEWSLFLFSSRTLKIAVSKMKTTPKWYPQLLQKEKPGLKAANCVSCAMLFRAIRDNRKIPKDYLLIYLLLNYYGQLNPPSASNIVISPSLSPWAKVASYRSTVLSWIYDRKEYFFYPIILGQILSDLLTPTSLNKRYLAGTTESRVLTHIWMNFSLSARSHSINWIGLAKWYIIHNAVSFGLVGAYELREKRLEFTEKEKETAKDTEKEEDNVRDRGWRSWAKFFESYSVYAFHKSNSYVNLLYLSNLFAMFAIFLSSPILAGLIRPYLHSSKNLMRQLYKNYIKLMGVIGGSAALFVNSLNIVHNYGYDSNQENENNTRVVSKSFLHSMNLYLFRLILLSKWRYTKRNYPYFRTMHSKFYADVESFLVCFGVFKIMNLSDFVYQKGSKRESFNELKNDNLIKLIRKL